MSTERLDLKIFCAQFGKAIFRQLEISLETDFQKWIYVEKKIIFRMAEMGFRRRIMVATSRYLRDSC